MIARTILQTLGWLAVLGAVLFLAAGDWRWPQAWAFLIELGIASLAVGLWLARRDPALLAARLSAPVQRDQPPWDRVFMAAFFVVFFVWLAAMGLDARRYGWSQVPLPVQALGGVLVALAMAAVWQTFRYNSFAAPQVRVQVERGHRTTTDGPYRRVRHPLYAGALVWLLGTALTLGSWWGMFGVPLIGTGLAWRAVREERLLRRELPGYDAYMKQVRLGFRVQRNRKPR